ncbi:GntR family transcriptional regulator [Sediminicoccus sp. KRV36]|uniref:GntR family transcriptional regulator n=1 Tax=Sediminicoccus sp. KRV36 TaxID=3133721 RepID=UPI00200C9685|nr:GntR family transcriptional regulator [Sediminicoccus rosea]UPY38662.1 GntR family transcriptional regulator [Sediminicoccus rosea]
MAKPETFSSGGATLADTLRHALRADIVAGRLAPGAPLRTSKLCQLYGCSLAPLREALASLTATGLVIAESQRGFRVAPVSAADWRDIMARRGELEPQALRASLLSAGDEWEGEVVRCHHQFALISRRAAAGAALIGEEWEARHRALHLALIGGCGSGWLLRICGLLYDHADRYRRLALLQPRRLKALTAEEDAIVAAALRRDAAQACTLLEAHIAGTRDAVLAASRLWAPEIRDEHAA